MHAARFCILEQFLPRGSDHPFAQTMLRHFDKLQTPIQAVMQYPTLGQHCSRFEQAGWSTITICRNLWDLWSDATFTPPALRHGLDTVEPFDEWEEFALFASHYFLLVASNTVSKRPCGSPAMGRSHMDASGTDTIDMRPIIMTPHLPPKHSKWSPRRFGAAFALDPDTVVSYGGQGLRCRLGGIDVMRRGAPKSKVQPCPLTPPQPRVCHTVTHMDNHAALLVGGRTSPTNALADCWLVKHGAWEQVQSLSPARFRHSAVGLKIPNNDCTIEGVLVFGGKTSDGTILDEWTLWTSNEGWKKIPINGPRPFARFGAAISSVGSAQNGFLIGGIGPCGTVLEDLWEWHATAAHPHLKLIDRTNDIQSSTASLTRGRIGACLVPFRDSVLLIGGVSKTQLPTLSEDLLVISEHPGTIIRIETPALSIAPPKAPWPLLVGFGAAAVSRDEIVITGGGAVCFSMGSFWNEGFFVITAEETAAQTWTATVSHAQGGATTPDPLLPPNLEGKQQAKPNSFTSLKSAAVVRAQLQSPEEFATLLAASEPVILEGLDIGPCRELWTPAFLKQRIGPDREIIVHECQSDRMTFKDKNFQYVKKRFGEFIDEILAGSKSYLRAVSSSQPNKYPTMLENDFPTIASDFTFPAILDFVRENLHSSPLRISGPVALWLHYDVLANILCQIHGSKTLHLFPPSDVKHLSYPPGGSSSNVDVLTSKDPSLLHTHPHIAFLKPGDVLFIPPMWSHTAIPEEGTSVALNVFFKNLQNGYAAGKDVYGNRDLQAYENGRRDVEKILKAFKNVPDDIARFYLDRLAAEIQEKSDAMGKKGQGQ
jgi:tRNA wybutosine-synthesizing protein 4